MHRYSHYKASNYPERLDTLRQGGIIAPTEVQIFPMNPCNANCSFCCYARDNKDRFDYQDKIPWKIMDKLLWDCHMMGVDSILISGGGEPTWYPEFNKLMDALEKFRFKIAIITNGKLMSKLYDRDLAWLRISLNAATHHTYSVVQGEKPHVFTHVCREIKKMTDMGKDVGAGMVIVYENIHEIVAFANLCRELGCSNVRYVVDNNFEHGDKNPMSKHFNKIYYAIDQAINDFHDDDFKVFGLPDRMDSIQNKKDYKPCYYQQFVTTVTANAEIYACCTTTYQSEFLLGDLKTQSFKDIWYGDKRQEFIANFDARKCPPCGQDIRNKYIQYLVENDDDSPHNGFI